MGYYTIADKVRPGKGRLIFTMIALTGLLGLGIAYRPNAPLASAVTPPDSCFAFSAGTITDYYDNENNEPLDPACPRNVDIPSTIGGETVTTIGFAAFAAKSLTSVTLPNTITTIETASFDNNLLTEVMIPDSVITVNNSAFSNNQLTEIFIPDSVTSFHASSFISNPLQSITIGTPDFSGTPELIIPSGAFDDMPTLTHVNLGENVLEIGSAFRNNNISSLTLGGSITSIASSAFSGNQLTSLVIPNSVTHMGPGAVFQNNPLESVTIGTNDFVGTPELVIPSGMFSNVLTLTTLNLGNNVLTISPYSFDGASISSLAIPDSVTSIGAGAFQNNNISQLTLGNSLTSIGNAAFYNNQITELFIPNSVTSIGVGIVSGNPITSITVGTADFSGTPSLYLSGGTFYDLPTLTSINLGNNIVGIGSGSLQNNSLTSLVIPNSVVTLYPGIASGNPIQSITIGTSDFSGTPDTEIMSNAFGGIPTLSEVNLGENVTIINPVAFAGGSIEHVTIPASVTSISYQAFMDNPLKSVTILGNPTIQQNSFSYNLDLSTIPDGLTGEDLAQYYQDNADYVRMYATDPEFIAAHSPGLTNTETFGANTYVVSGYILNPATYTVDYESSQGETLAPQFIGGTGPTLADYSIATNPTGDFSLYYTTGDSVTLQPLNIEGYSTPNPYQLTLVSGVNNHTFSYASGQLADTGMNQLTLVTAGSLLILIALTGAALVAHRYI